MSNNGRKMEQEDWAPGFYIKHFIQDMRIAVEEADQRGAELPVLKQVLGLSLIHISSVTEIQYQATVKLYGVFPSSRG